MIPKKPSKPKYRNIKVTYNGMTFDSTKEKNYYLILKDREHRGEIHDLKLQVPYELQPSYELNGKKIRNIVYIADFVYMENIKGEIPISREVVADVKPSKNYQTTEYKLKKKMFGYKYGVEIKELY